MKNENLLDNYTVKLDNRCPINSKRYDEVFFVPLNLEKKQTMIIEII